MSARPFEHTLFRHALRLSGSEAPAPHFREATRFYYDDTFGAATLPNLAREVMGGYARYTTSGAVRVYVWRDNGEFIGSVVVNVLLVPKIHVLDATIDRGLPA